MNAAVSADGFPSGHAAVAAALVTVVSPFLTRPARMAVWIIVWLVAPARVFVGAHLPWDVAGGVFLGWGVGSRVNVILAAASRQHDGQNRADTTSVMTDREHA